MVDPIIDYLNGLKPGERVIETADTCLKGMQGTVYISENEGVTKGSLCVLWDNKMGTGVTWGTRRIGESIRIDKFAADDPISRQTDYVSPSEVGDRICQWFSIEPRGKVEVVRCP